MEKDYNSSDEPVPEEEQYFANEVDLDELSLASVEMRTLEKGYYNTKKKINQLDVETLRVLNLIKTLKQCYQTIKTHLGRKKNMGDTLDVKKRIDDSYDKMTSVNAQFSKFKGKFMALHDQFINKN